MGAEGQTHPVHAARGRDPSARRAGDGVFAGIAANSRGQRRELQDTGDRNGAEARPGGWRGDGSRVPHRNRSRDHQRAGEAPRHAA